MPRIKSATLIALLYCLMAASHFPLYGDDNIDHLYRLYTNQSYDKLINKIQQLSDNGYSNTDFRFFEALLLQNAEKAVKEFEYVYEHGTERIKVLAAQKLMDYFYARGYYVTASRYQKYIAENEQLEIDTEGQNEADPEAQNVQQEEANRFYIQVGAFSLKDNAERLSDMLATQHIDAQIVEKKVNGRQIFRVWISGKNTFESTLNYANDLKTKYDLDYRIIKE